MVGDTEDAGGRLSRLVADDVADVEGRRGRHGCTYSGYLKPSDMVN